jgi:hypothetical protein
MHSPHPSRGRILFEVLCAFAIATSFVGAWKQTGAWTLLPAALVAALYGFFHLFDMSAPQAASAAAEPQRIEFESEAAEVVVPMVAAEDPPAVDSVEAAEVVELAASRAGSGLRSGSRKGTGRRAKTTKAAKAAEPAATEEMQAPWPMVDEPRATESQVEDDFAFSHDDGPAHPQIAPLFEPEPFAKMPRRAFGRRGRI